MVKKILKYAVILVIASMLTMTIVEASESYQGNDQLNTIDNYEYINDLLFESSRYTQTDEMDQDVLDTYHDEFQVDYSENDLQLLGFEKIFDTDELNVYFEKDSFSVMVYNKTTGYMWSSRPEFQGISGVREDNVAMRNLMNSGLWVEYVRALNVSNATMTTASLYTIADTDYVTSGAITEENSDPLSPYQLVENSYDYDAVTTTISSRSQTSVTVDVDIKDLDFRFNVVLSVSGSELMVYIPNDSIEESGDIYRLTSIQVFPYLGAARENKIPGYMVIPDGAGALVRLNKDYNTYFQGRFYGSDLGYQSNTISQLTLPIYGMVHEVGQNAFYATILEGSEDSLLTGRFWGNSSHYQRINTKFNLRQIYQYVINRAGDGNDAIYDEMVKSNYRIAYDFLSQDDASYVGIAKDYRDKLIASGILTSREAINDNQIPLQLSYIMSDQEPTFFGSKTVRMTTPEQVDEIYNEFKDMGINNQQTTFMGWSRDGFINQSPYRTRIRYKNDYKDLINEMNDDGNLAFFENDYIYSSEVANRISYNGDVARDLSRLKMSYRSRTLNGQVTDIYYLYPDSSLDFAENDVDFFKDLGASGLDHSSMGATLYSYYDGDKYDRSDTKAYYEEIASLYQKNLFSVANQYLYAYMYGYMNMPITNAQYDYYTDLVPLIPMVLKGSVSYYTEYLNFNALEDDRLLMMVDFGVNPSYVLTYEETYNMRYTPASSFYTTTYSNYKDEIKDTYMYISQALNQVIGAQIVNREVLATGFVKVSYDNGKAIYVNYTYETVYDGTLAISPRSYEVIEL